VNGNARQHVRSRWTLEILAVVSNLPVNKSVENVASTHSRLQSRSNHELILVAHSTRPVDLSGVSEDFVRFNEPAQG